ncbi:hypothetical protein F5148DRAFT_1160872, partial [Russula earlei]
RFLPRAHFSCVELCSILSYSLLSPSHARSSHVAVTWCLTGACARAFVRLSFSFLFSFYLTPISDRRMRGRRIRTGNPDDT